MIRVFDKSWLWGHKCGYKGGIDDWTWHWQWDIPHLPDCFKIRTVRMWIFCEFIRKMLFFDIIGPLDYSIEPFVYLLGENSQLRAFRASKKAAQLRVSRTGDSSLPDRCSPFILWSQTSFTGLFKGYNMLEHFVIYYFLQQYFPWLLLK